MQVILSLQLKMCCVEESAFSSCLTRVSVLVNGCTLSPIRAMADSAPKVCRSAGCQICDVLGGDKVQALAVGPVSEHISSRVWQQAKILLIILNELLYAGTERQPVSVSYLHPLLHVPVLLGSGV